MKLMPLLIKAVIPIALLASSLALSFWLLSHPQEAQKGLKPPEKAALVSTSHAEHGSYNIPIEAMGQIIPATQIMLRAQLSGEILSIHDEFVPGGHLTQGETILQIDPADYQIALQKQQAIMQQAGASYQLELGRQKLAKEELTILSRTTGKKPDDTDLALRVPQLLQAEAELQKARADLEKAELDMRRTQIFAPFNALVTERHVTAGDKISTQDTLAQLVGTDEYWIDLSVPVTDLQWLGAGSKATIFMDNGRGTRTGYLLKQTGNLNNESRFASLLVAVKDPLQSPPLILGDYVKVILDGHTLDNSVRIPLPWLRDGNTVWLVENGKLAIQNVKIIYNDRDFAYIAAGIKPDDLIITSQISVPVNGMALRTMEEARKNVQEQMIKPQERRNENENENKSETEK